MSFESERQAIFNHFKSNWNEADAKVFWENLPFKQPESTFVFISIIPLTSEKACISSTHFDRFFSEVQVDIYSLEDKGTKIPRELADKVVSIFNSINLTCSDLDKLTFRTPRLQNFGVRLGRYRLAVLCPFFRNAVSS